MVNITAAEVVSNLNMKLNILVNWVCSVGKEAGAKL